MVRSPGTGARPKQEACRAAASGSPWRFRGEQLGRLCEAGPGVLARGCGCGGCDARGRCCSSCGRRQVAECRDSETGPQASHNVLMSLLDIM